MAAQLMHSRPGLILYFGTDSTSSSICPRLLSMSMVLGISGTLIPSGLPIFPTHGTRGLSTLSLFRMRGERESRGKRASGGEVLNTGGLTGAESDPVEVPKAGFAS